MDSSTENILQYSHVGFSYSESKVLFENISMGFKKGCFYMIQGASGSGKTTFLRLANRLEEPTKGEIQFQGAPLASYHPTVLRRSLLYIQQTPQVIDRSVRDNLLLPFSFKRNRDLPVPDDMRMKALLKQLLLVDVGLEDSATNLSTGQRQRICLIRGLLLSPEVVLLDEPVSALDDRSGLVVQDIAAGLCRDTGLTVLMVSHRPLVSVGIDPVRVTIDAGEIFT